MSLPVIGCIVRLLIQVINVKFLLHNIHMRKLMIAFQILAKTIFKVQIQASHFFRHLQCEADKEVKKEHHNS